MRNILLSWLVILSIYPSTLTAQTLDSIDRNPRVNTIQYQQIPSLLYSIQRYNILSDYSDNLKIHDFNFKIQQLLRTNGRDNYSLSENFQFLKENYFDSDKELKQATPQDIQFGIWRSKLIKIKNENELKDLMDYGVNFLLKTNTNNSLPDYMRFVTMLMQEQVDLHYDENRLTFTGGNSAGVYGIVDILRTFETQDKTVVAGVCRDVHDMGLRMMRQICKTYYAHAFPGTNFDFDKYLFVQSWATQASQHMTVSFIDPKNPDNTYELDWGRVTEKDHAVGYDHGRNYGNAYKIWKFDPGKNFLRAVDSKKTIAGNLLDDQLFSEKDFDTYSGIKYVEPYSSAVIKRKFPDRWNLNLGFGTMAQNQKFAVGTVFYNFKERKLGKVLRLKGLASFQGLAIEELDKKNTLYPNYNFTTAFVFYVAPRLMLGLYTRPFVAGKHFTYSFWTDNSIEAVAYKDYFHASNIRKYNGDFFSGDASINNTQGVTVNFQKQNFPLFSELRIQNRGFLAAKEARLMSANPSSLIPNLRMISAAQDLILYNTWQASANFTVKSKTVFEYTSMKSFLLYQNLSLSRKFHRGNVAQFQIGLNRNLNGITYFWLLPSRKWLEVSYINKDQKARIGLSVMQFHLQEWTAAVNFTLSL